MVTVATSFEAPIKCKFLVAVYTEVKFYKDQKIFVVNDDHPQKGS